MNDAAKKRMLHYFDGTIDETELAKLEDQLRNDSECREAFLGIAALEYQLRTGGVQTEPEVLDVVSRPDPMWWVRGAGWFAFAASILFIAIWFRGNENEQGIRVVEGESRGGASMNAGQPSAFAQDQVEPLLAGHAILSQMQSVKWVEQSPRYEVGDTIQRGPLRFLEGSILIDFFCGASMVVEGPAELVVLSDWKVELQTGRCRVLVPEAAQGFVVETAESEIIDLGTEFVVYADEDSSEVAVVDGEVKVKSREESGESRLTTGESMLLAGTETSIDPSQFASKQTIENHARADTAARFESWKRFTLALSVDPRVIAHFPFGLREIRSGVAEQRSSHQGSSNAVLVGKTLRVANRFGQPERGIELGHPASRVRFRVEGEFPAMTLSCWVRVDALNQPFSSLVMADSYEPGEPHWQLSQNGRLMLSVMAGSELEAPSAEGGTDEDWVVWQKPWHKVYYSPVIWDLSKSGRWMHVVSVYDPPRAEVRH
ncbi:MAG: FecR family protein, partial [Planctomycetota bacterium]